MDLIFPFNVGDAVELKSFTVGYRGAWFRCKIIDSCVRNGHMAFEVEHIDYPDEKRSWTRLYQIPPGWRKKKASKKKASPSPSPKRELMLRPPFPQWCWDNHSPQHGQKMDVVAVVSSPWKVGDWVDWWHNCCFWTGKIIELLGDGKVKILCLEKPLGEGGDNVVDPDDLRPALDWSLEKGWSAPLSQENGECWYTARLITQIPDTGSSDEDIEQCYDGNKEVQKCLNGSFDTPKQEMSKCLNRASVALEKVMEEPQKCTNEDPDTSLGVIHPTSQLAPDEVDECCMNSQADFPTSPMAALTSCKRLKTSTEHSSVPDTVGDALINVEKLAHKIRRAQDLLRSIEDAAPSSKAVAPSWRFYR